jgi:hypothetical protein
MRPHHPLPSRRRSRATSSPRAETLEVRLLPTAFPVTTTTDGGPGSLRQAIIDANAAPGADTITLPAGTYTLTIAGTGEDAAAKGDLDITGDLTIAGAGAATTVIDGGGLDNVFQAIGNITANFSGVTIRNAAGGTNPAAGILSDRATLNITACTFTGNPGVDIRTNSGAVAVADSTFVGVNKKSDGLVTGRNGGGPITATRDTFTGYADGIVSSGDATIDNCTFSGNFDGLTSSGTVTMADTTIRDNSGDGIDGSHILKITRCTITGNAGDGIDGNDTLTLTDSTISGNGGDGLDGALTVTMTRSAISNNGGDGIDGSNALTITDSTISNNGGDGIDGSKAVTMTRSTISGNSHIGIDGGGVLTITNSTISGNAEGILGAGGNSTLNFVTIANNEVFGIELLANATIGNSILSAPSGGQNVSGGTLTSLGNNISSDASVAAAFTQPGDRNSTDPMIGPLADNGGPTRTHALLPGSPAIDAAGTGAGVPATDQRGVARPQGTAADVGAFELVQAETTIATQTSLSSSAPSATAGQPVTFTAAVTAPGSRAVPSGTVQFLEGPTVLGTGTLDASGRATFATASLPVGAHAVVASFVANGAFTASQSPALMQAINPAPPAATATQLTTSASSATVGQATTFTATVAGPPGSGIPTGVVTFLDGATPLGAIGLDAVGRAVLTTSALGVGTHTIAASYGGDTSFSPSTSAVATVVIDAAPATPAPAVTGVLRYGYHWMPTTLVLGFSQPLDAAGAQDAANYRLVAPDGRPIGVAAASYDAASRTVTLHPDQRLSPYHRYRLTVNGQPPDGLRGVSGSFLDGQGGNHPGTNFTTFVSLRNLVLGGPRPSGATRVVALRPAHAMSTPLAARAPHSPAGGTGGLPIRVAIRHIASLTGKLPVPSVRMK